MGIRPEEIRPGVRVLGLIPGQEAVIEAASDLGGVIEVLYRDPQGNRHSRLLYLDDLENLSLSSEKRWSFDADPGLFRLAAEARRLRLAYLFDPMLAVHTSLVEPLPHQIEAVYGHFLPRRPLRFLLADDPGAGKTIMAGLYMRELLIRGDLERALVVAPGALVEQWQEELDTKFHLPFEILTRDRVEASRTGNPFQEHPYWIARLDQLARGEDLRKKLKAVDWDLVVIDEAHKLSATYYGNEVKATKRYRLGQLLSDSTRNLLLLTATPHRGKEEDFRLFLALLDPDRFEGKPRDKSPPPDPSDLMLRRLKEDLVRFDGTPLFPERRAYTVTYQLSEDEKELYEEVTCYVREEMNRAERLRDPNQRATVGFALTVLQRRLASSPLAITRSLERRKKRLQDRLKALRTQRPLPAFRAWSEEDISEREEYAFPEDDEFNEVLDEATAAQTAAELEAEIQSLDRLIALAHKVLRNGEDRKWNELASLLEQPPIRGRKLVIFTEHRDTIEYLAKRLSTYLGDPGALVVIHGGMRREERRNAQTRFTQDKAAKILLATDAAGEGINLQQAHLLINYDLPWNPNRLEQRFGRIHRIGQTEVCHMWNLVAEDTREGDVLLRLFEKIEEARRALGGKVFDVLGRAFADKPLKDLILEAIRYGERPEVRARLFRAIEGAVDVKRLQDLLQREALAAEVLSPAKLKELKEQMERAEALRLQPHYMASFFRAALEALGGSISPREGQRFEVNYVPAKVRQAAHRGPLLRSYHRVTFEKNQVQLPGKPVAEFLAPGHPLFDAVLTASEQEWGGLLQSGAVLVDPSGGAPRLLFAYDHSIKDSRGRVVSRRLLYLEVFADGQVRPAGPAPYLDYRPPTPEELERAQAYLARLDPQKLLPTAERFALTNLAKEHFDEVKRQQEVQLNRVLEAVRERLLSEIYYWDGEAARLDALAKEGKRGAAQNAEKARRRAEELRERLRRREREIEEARHLAPERPYVFLAALVTPPLDVDASYPEAETRQKIEEAAVKAVLEAERRLGNSPVLMPPNWPGYDIESRTPEGDLRLIEVKGKGKSSRVVTLSRTQLLTALNKPENWWLALVEVGKESGSATVHYVRLRNISEPDFGVTSVNYDLQTLSDQAEFRVKVELPGADG